MVVVMMLVVPDLMMMLVVLAVGWLMSLWAGMLGLLLHMQSLLLQLLLIPFCWPTANNNLCTTNVLVRSEASPKRSGRHTHTTHRP